MLGSCFTQLKLNCSGTAILFSSDDISVGGHLWRIRCYPCGGPDEENNGQKISLLLELRSRSATRGIRAIFDAFVMDKAGSPSPNPGHGLRSMQVYTPPQHAVDNRRVRHWHKFDVRASDLQPLCGADGCATLICGIVVMGFAGAGAGDAIPVPPSDVVAHLGRLLGGGVGSDVSFVVGGERFPAHRAVLAARSPVFRAQLCGSTADATAPSIALQDIEPATFRIMLVFMYTDKLPGFEELGSPPDEAVQHLLAAADRYALDRLKLFCAQKIWESVTADTVASALVLADTYSCPELKSRCMDFFAVEKNMKDVMFTDGFLWLVQKFPALAAELKDRIQK